jgi:FkbM family methyltransferase
MPRGARVGASSMMVLRKALDLLPVMPVLRGPMKGVRWHPASTDHGAWLGTYERKVQEELARTVQPGWTCWDIGANVGIFTLLMARLVGPTGRVQAIEPSPGTLHHLRANLRLNRSLGSRVSVHEVAASDRDGFQYFASDGESWGALADSGSVIVRTARLDSLPLPPPNLVKLDVEGHELAALCGMRRTLEQHRPILFIEFHGAGLPARDMDTEARCMLESLGYSLRQLTPSEVIAT